MIPFIKINYLQSSFSQIKSLLPVTKIIHLTNVNTVDLRGFYGELSDYIGNVVNVDENPATGVVTHNVWVDIRFDPSLCQYFRHSNSAQCLHTDAAYVNNPAEIAFFYCEKPAISGGESTFLDGIDLVYWLNKDAGLLLDIIQNTKLKFGKGPRNRIKPIITFDSKGPLLNWNFYRVDATSDVAKEFNDFLWNLLKENKHREVNLKRGEAVFFHDERVLHGRNAFEATKSGDRILWKGGMRLEKNE